MPAMLSFSGFLLKKQRSLSCPPSSAPETERVHPWPERLFAVKSYPPFNGLIIFFFDPWLRPTLPGTHSAGSSRGRRRDDDGLALFERELILEKFGIVGRGEFGYCKHIPALLSPRTSSIVSQAAACRFHPAWSALSVNHTHMLVLSPRRGAPTSAHAGHRWNTGVYVGAMWARTGRRVAPSHRTRGRASAREHA